MHEEENEKPPPDPKPTEDAKPEWPGRREIHENEYPKDYLNNKSD
jgi:hypothetical protein